MAKTSMIAVVSSLCTLSSHWLPLSSPPPRRTSFLTAARARPRPLMVEQHVAGAVDLGREIIRAAMVGVQFHHQSAMRLLDRLGVGAGCQAEDGVCLLDGHVAARRAPGAAGTLAGELIAPI